VNYNDLGYNVHLLVPKGKLPWNVHNLFCYVFVHNCKYEYVRGVFFVCDCRQDHLTSCSSLCSLRHNLIRKHFTDGCHRFLLNAHCHRQLIITLFKPYNAGRYMTHFNFQTLYSNIGKFDIFILHRKSKHTLGKEKKISVLLFRFVFIFTIGQYDKKYISG